MTDKTTRILKRYCKKGFKLFPVNASKKTPCIKDYPNLASDDFAEIENWLEKFPGCNWAIMGAPSGLVFVDVDTAHGGMESWQALIDMHGEPETLMAESGNGGLHYVFKAKDTQRYRGKIQKGIDVKHNGYILVYPSIHPRSKLQYRWKNFKESKISNYPEWVSELIEKGTHPNRKDSPIYKFGHNYLDKLVSELREFDLDYEEWYQAGMAIKTVEPGVEGLNLFIHLTQGKSYQEGDIEKAKEKWESFSNDEEVGVTQKTLVWLIRQKGGVVPNPTFDSDKKIFEKETESKILTLIDECSDGFKLVDGNYLCSDKKVVVEEINKLGISFIIANTGAPYAKVNKMHNGELTCNTLKKETLRNQIAEYFYIYEKWLANGTRKMVRVPAVDTWIDDARKTRYDKIVFKPKAPTSELNLWSPIPCEPLEGSCQAVTDLIFEAICNGNDARAKWLTQWLAHIVQKPEEKSTIVPVLMGKQGTGKGLLFDGIMGTILGHFYYKIMTAKALTKTFNISMMNKFLTFIDEATWGGNHTEDGILKSLTGSDTLTIEEKFGSSFNIEQYSRYAIASNNDNPVAFEVSNRRYCGLDASSKIAGSLKFFDPIWKEVRKGKLVNRFYGHLLDLDLKGFDPHKLPENNKTAQEAKIISAGPVSMFWDDVLKGEPRQIFHNFDFLDSSIVFEEYKEFCKETNLRGYGIGKKRFWSKTKQLIPALEQSELNRAMFDGQRFYGFYIDPDILVKSFCENLRIEMPKDFDFMEYSIEE